jgi:hypothetical protein
MFCVPFNITLVSLLFFAILDVPPGRNMYYLSESDTSQLTLIAVDVAYDDFIQISDILLRRGQTLQATINNFGTYFDSSSHY